MEQRWTSDGAIAKEKRNQSEDKTVSNLTFPTLENKFYMTRDKKKDFLAKRRGIFLVESFFLYIFALRKNKQEKEDDKIRFIKEKNSNI